jgi:hypothetical protein
MSQYHLITSQCLCVRTFAIVHWGKITGLGAFMVFLLFKSTLLTFGIFVDYLISENLG